MKNKIKKVLILSFLICIIDQIIKYFIRLGKVNTTIIPGFFNITYAENDGVAFSMLSGNRIIILIISIILILLLIYMLFKDYLKKDTNDTLKLFSFSFIFGGVLGNLFDRIYRKVVIDYISLTFFNFNYPIFNLADIFITLGIILMFIYTLKDEK